MDMSRELKKIVMVLMGIFLAAVGWLLFVSAGF
jgi:hypothetical protein